MKKPNINLEKIRTVIAYVVCCLCMLFLIMFCIYKEAYASLIAFILSIFACFFFDSYGEKLFKIKDNQEDKKDKK